MSFAFNGRATRNFLTLVVVMHFILLSTGSTWPRRQA